MNEMGQLLKGFEICDKDNAKAKENTYDEIILIGPIGCGKSATAEFLSKALRIPRYTLDNVKWAFFDELEGYDRTTEKEVYRKGGFEGLCRYWEPFEAHAVKRTLETYHNCVFDFGGGLSVYQDYKLFDKVKETLQPYKNVILLLPSKDTKESIQILQERLFSTYKGHEQESKIYDMCRMNEQYLTNPCNIELAKKIIYTKGKDKEAVVKEVLQITRGKDKTIDLKAGRNFEF